MGVLEQFDGGREKGGQGKTRQTLGRVETRENPSWRTGGVSSGIVMGFLKTPSQFQLEDWWWSLI